VDAGSPWLWLALGGVVVVLLGIVAKLLPRAAEN
jgi:ABC-type phosphate transport system auxiliary subunit